MLKTLRKAILAAVTVTLASFVVRAQVPQTAQGTVIDSAGEPVIGATVLVKGTLKGTSTDIDGHFSLSPVRTGDVLQVSSIGYLPLEITWDGSPVNVTLQEDRLALEESVVVGYGVQKKVNVTGAVSMVDSDVLESRPVQTVSQALQGQIPGLNFSVTNGGGELNQNMSFNVRGTGTIGDGSTAAPLVLIDGIEGDMNTVNPNDIESISVLKDAASSSIYGARGAFGVILINTKSGKAGKTHVSYTGNVIFNSPVHLPKMMDSIHFYKYWNRAALNNGQALPFGADIIQRIEDYAAGIITTGTVAQNDGTVFGSGAHDKTGRHCLPKDPNGKLDITKYAKFWLMEDGKPTRRFNHLCWDGCMFPNSAMTNPQTWNDVLGAMKNVRDACGWR